VQGGNQRAQARGGYERSPQANVQGFFLNVRNHLAIVGNIVGERRALRNLPARDAEHKDQDCEKQDSLVQAFLPRVAQRYLRWDYLSIQFYEHKC